MSASATRRPAPASRCWSPPAADRVVAAVLFQPVGHRQENPDVMYKSGKDVWPPELLARRPDLNMAMVDKYPHDLYRVRPDFVYSVSRDFARSCQTPMLVMPDDTPAHPYQTSVDIASLVPNAEVTVYPWREPPELKERTINRVRTLPKGASTRDSEPLSPGAWSRCRSWLSRRPQACPTSSSRGRRRRGARATGSMARQRGG